MSQTGTLLSRGSVEYSNNIDTRNKKPAEEDIPLVRRAVRTDG